MVVPSSEGTAESEFIALFEKATGHKFVAVNDAEQLGEGVNYISLGYTSLFSNSGLNITEEKTRLGVDGARVYADDDGNIYIFGGSEKGTEFAVYTFMREYFNFEMYSRNCYYLDDLTQNEIIEFKPYTDIEDIPDVEYRYSNVGATQNTANTVQRQYEFDAGLTTQDYNNRVIRYGLSSSNESQLCISLGSSVPYLHNALEYVAGMESKTNWFSSNNSKQLCYTAHGVESDYNELVAHCANKILTALQNYSVSKYPNKNYVTLLQEDGGGFCECTECKKHYNVSTKDYQGLSGLMINFANDVINQVYAGMNGWESNIQNLYKRDNLKLVTFAYAQSQYVPATYSDSTGEWTMLDGYERPNENVVVWLAPSYMSFTTSIDAQPEFKQNIEGWSAISEGKEMWYWLYNQYYLTPNYFCDNFNFITSDTYKFLVENKATLIKNETEMVGSTSITAFNDLKFYLETRLGWDSTLDSDTLIENYFNNMYKEAATDMKAVFQKARDNFSEKGLVGSKNNVYTNTSSYYSKQWLLEYISALDGAMAKIDTAMNAGKYTEAQATLIKSRIAAEYVFPYFALFEIYGEYLELTDYSTYKNNLSSLVNAYFPTYRIFIYDNGAELKMPLTDYITDYLTRV